VQSINTRVVMSLLTPSSSHFRLREPVPGPVTKRADRQHDRHFNQDPDRGSKRCTRSRAEQRDSGCDRQVKKAAGANQSPWSSHGMPNLEQTHEPGQGPGLLHPKH
jgi:hypothetical protein